MANTSGSKHTAQSGGTETPPVHKHPVAPGNKYYPNGDHLATNAPMKNC